MEVKVYVLLRFYLVEHPMLIAETRGTFDVFLRKVALQS